MDNPISPPIDYRDRLRPAKRKQLEACAACSSLPQDEPERNRLRELARQYVAENALVAPLDWDQLREHTRELMQAQELPAEYHDFLLILVSNEAWRPILNRIPYEKRVLLLPQCLRDPKTCPAHIDAFGLLCEECGRCPIGKLQNRAETLGYSVVVAEGTTLVTELIEQGTVQAVIGVSCLPVLERAYPHMTAHAVPGIALPLLKEGCTRTRIDNEWLIESLEECAPEADYSRLDLAALRDQIQAWFAPSALTRLLGEPTEETERYARDWLATGGKRWRPLLTVAAYLAITGRRDAEVDSLKKLAVAVECFHKASLAHDDIADQEDDRYDEPTLHHQFDLPIALNIGDYLQGEGYRLLAEAGFDAQKTGAMVASAARGHCELSLGQGEELRMRFERTQPSFDKALSIMRQKTAPAFSVALLIGAQAAGADNVTCSALHTFSNHLGTAYQVRDDLMDVTGAAELNGDKPASQNGSEEAPMEISVVNVLARQIAAEKELSPSDALEEARFRSEQLLEQHRFEAVRSIRALVNSDLKSILHRLITRILPYDNA